MADYILVDVQGIPRLQAKLAQFPQEAQDAAVDAASDYLVNVLKAYPTPRYISRAEAYPDAPAGPGWFSERQRRYVMAAISRGEISTPYSRTQGLANAWKRIGQGVRSFIANDSPSADYVMGEGQSRHEARVGWKKASAIAQERIGQIERRALAAVQKVIRRLKLG